jgi:hypothetical protein
MEMRRMIEVNKWITEFFACVLMISAYINKDELLSHVAIFLLIQALIRSNETRDGDAG